MLKPLNPILHNPPIGVSGLVNLGAREMLNKARRHLIGYTPHLAKMRVVGLRLALPGLIVGDKEWACNCYGGRFTFNGQTVERVVFPMPLAQTPSYAWYEEFHSFAWLADMEACGRELTRAQARAVISDWINSQGGHGSQVWQGQNMANRLINWVRYAPFLITGASENFSTSFYNNLARHIRRLQAGFLAMKPGKLRLQYAIALAYAAIGLDGLQGMQDGIFTRLANEIEEQILPDGGHISRNPTVLVKLLLDLMPLRLALEENRQQVPKQFNAVLERMLPMVRFFCHGDGELAIFNGADDQLGAIIKVVLDNDDIVGRPLVHALHSGYARLARGASTVIADIGRPPMPGVNEQACSGPLAFEFSDGLHRIVVNCGHSRNDKQGWNSASRLTAAHSTISLGGKSAGKIIDNRVMQRIFDGPVIMGPREIKSEIIDNGGGVLLEAQHDGYLSAYAIKVQRNLFLSSDGDDLRGEDRFRLDLEQAAKFDETPFDIRFHLHPSVNATLSRDATSVMLMLPNKKGWRFSVRGGSMQLEESIYLAGSDGPRQTQQIVVQGVAGRTDRIMWAFKRITKRKYDSDAKDAAPELPLD